MMVPTPGIHMDNISPLCIMTHAYNFHIITVYFTEIPMLLCIHTQHDAYEIWTAYNLSN